MATTMPPKTAKERAADEFRKAQKEKAADEFRKAKKLWQILALALADIAKAEKRKGVEIDMGAWLEFRGADCAVCFAGAVMLCRFDLSRFGDRASISPHHFRGDDAVSQKFQALNHLRSGLVGEAYVALTGKLSKAYEACCAMDRVYETVHYANDPKRWRAQMKALLADLKKANL